MIRRIINFTDIAAHLLPIATTQQAINSLKDAGVKETGAIYDSNPFFITDCPVNYAKRSGDYTQDQLDGFATESAIYETEKFSSSVAWAQVVLIIDPNTRIGVLLKKYWEHKGHKVVLLEKKTLTYEEIKSSQDLTDDFFANVFSLPNANALRNSSAFDRYKEAVEKLYAKFSL